MARKVFPRVEKSAVQAHASASDATQTELLEAPSGENQFYALEFVAIYNSSATDDAVQLISEDAGGGDTVIATFPAPAGGGVVINCGKLLGSLPGEALDFAAVTGVDSIFVTVGGVLAV